MPFKLPPSATLSSIRVNIFPRGGEKRHFNLYRIPFVDGLVSPCGRVRVFKAELDNQYLVFVNEKRVPDHQFSVMRARKPSQYRPASAYKQTNGRATAATFTNPINL